ncbi:hypothetical protein Y032_0322g2428 [Ancylostoma ceylanicum]|nr:hypothetical protein Y032_0322g2428 [Ancylostoma ceylanicum]
MSEPPPAYEALQNPYVPTETKQPATNPEFPPNPSFPAGNYAPPPTMQQPAGAPGYAPGPVHTIVVGSIAFNQNPMSMTCPHCHQQILTKTSPKNGLLTWLLCGGMALFGQKKREKRNVRLITMVNRLNNDSTPDFTALNSNLRNSAFRSSEVHNLRRYASW